MLSDKHQILERANLGPWRAAHAFAFQAILRFFDVKKSYLLPILPIMPLAILLIL
jgi:hypothetical protein